MLGEPHRRRKENRPPAPITPFSNREQHRMPDRVRILGMRMLVAVVVVLALPAAALGEPRTVKPDRAAIDRLLDEFIPAAVAQKDLQRGWELSAEDARTVSHSEWMKGNTSVQKYPAKGTTFHGWLPNYSYPGDVGFDVLLQPTKASMGAWSFRGEAKKIHGQWKITTFYPVATFAPTGKTQTVLGPNDLGPANGAASPSGKSRLGAWVLALPAAFVGAIALIGLSIAGTRWQKNRSRIRAIERDLAADR
jgi:hypothetical protein